MSKPIQAISNDMGSLADDARGLIAATADIAGEKVQEARERLAAALEHGREIYDRVRAKESEGARAVDDAVRGHLYETIAIGVGVGLLVGWLAARGCSSCKRD
jgi:ElaB/YqjD/DUF883 family membrane-anchored ribosome-binding protein